MIKRSGVGLIALLGMLLSPAAPAWTQSVSRTADAASAASSPLEEVVTRESDGRATVRATRIAKPIVVDGRLDDEVYGQVPSISDLIQQEPFEGKPATEKTEIWLLFDDKNIYVSARCLDSHPERAIVKEMRRDNPAIFDNEMFLVSLDSFHDRRNAFIFVVNLSGGFTDGYMSDERDFNRDWNTVWDSKVARSDRGWTVEIVIPFKSLRYQAGKAQQWGVNFRRSVGWKNETAFLTQIPAAYGRRGMNKISSSATLVGLEPPTTTRNMEIKPYGITDLTTDRTASPPISNDVGRNGGLDLKVGVTKGLTADVSFNTDFAQVEADEQQVNLTRFNTFFAEKRDFFLEGSGIFLFGGVRNSPRDNIGPGGANVGTNPYPADMPNLFFSRRIGLNDGFKVPIRAGGRVTGKTGPYSVGLLDIRTGEDTRFGVGATNFAVARVKRDILRRSSIGALITHRSIASNGQGSNDMYGVDGVFSFYQNLNINTYLAKSQSAGPSGSDMSYRAQLDYSADRYGVQLEQLLLDDRFIPDVGFARRTAFRRSSGYLRFSPRPVSIKSIRKFTWDATYDYITTPDGRPQSRYGEAAFRTELQNGDNLAFEYVNSYEFLSAPFAVAPAVSIPVGGYAFPEARAMYFFGPQRKISGTLKVTRGSFYDGTRTEFTTFKNRVAVTSQLSVEPGLTVDWIDLPGGRFTTLLGSARTNFSITPRMTVAALMQYVSTNRALSTNVRFRWEYTPGSDFYIVYNDNRDLLHPGLPTLQSRSFVVKLTRLFRT